MTGLAAAAFGRAPTANLLVMGRVTAPALMKQPFRIGGYNQDLFSPPFRHGWVPSLPESQFEIVKSEGTPGNNLIAADGQAAQEGQL